MPAKNPRRRLPEEDLADTVAQIINSPITRANLSFLTAQPEPQPEGFETQPPGFKTIPVGVEPTPAVVEATPPQFTPKPIAAPPPRPLWQAENLGTLFEQNRVRRIERAQDALSLAEERIYDILWGARNLKRDEYRLTHYSLQRLAEEGRFNIKTVRELIPRLIDKGFIDIEHPADPRRLVPTLYRVWSYAAVLARQRERRRFFVVKTGKGVFYVHPYAASLSRLEPMGSGVNSEGLTPLGSEPAASMVASAPAGVQPLPPEYFASIKPMGRGGTSSIEIKEDSGLRHTSAPAYAQVLAVIRGVLRAEPDTALVDAMIADCHRNAAEATGEPARDAELLHFVQAKARVLAASPNIRNHLAVLRKALPACFAGEAFRIFRKASDQRTDRDEGPADRAVAEYNQTLEQDTSLWTAISERHRAGSAYDMQAIAEDPELNDKGRRIAQEILKRLGRYTPIGL